MRHPWYARLVALVLTLVKTEDAFPESADMGFALVGETASYGWKDGRKWGLTETNKAPII